MSKGLAAIESKVTRLGSELGEWHECIVVLRAMHSIAVAKVVSCFSRNWLGIARSKFCAWKQRYGKANAHNGLVPREYD